MNNSNYSRLSVRVAIMSGVGWLLTITGFFTSYWNSAKSIETERDIISEALLDNLEVSQTGPNEFTDHALPQTIARTSDQLADAISEYLADKDLDVMQLANDPGFTQIIKQSDDTISSGYSAVHTKSMLNIWHPDDSVRGKPLSLVRGDNPSQLFSWWRICEEANLSGHAEGYYWWKVDDKWQVKFMACRQVAGTDLVVASTAYPPKGVQAAVLTLMDEALYAASAAKSRGLYLATAISVPVAGIVVVFVHFVIRNQISRLNSERQRLEQHWEFASHQDISRGVWHQIKDELGNIGMSVKHFLRAFDRSHHDVDEAYVRELRTVPADVAEIQNKLKKAIGPDPTDRTHEEQDDEIEITTWLQDVARDTASRNGACSPSLSFPGRPRALSIRGNKKLLSVALGNLIDNAIAVTPEDKQVQVYACVVSKFGIPCFSVTVYDLGPGFADIDRAFKPGYTTKFGDGGTGLGLPIAQSIAIQHEGSVEIENTHNGAAVSLILPLKHDYHFARRTLLWIEELMTIAKRRLRRMRAFARTRAKRYLN